MYAYVSLSLSLCFYFCLPVSVSVSLSLQSLSILLFFSFPLAHSLPLLLLCIQVNAMNTLILFQKSEESVLLFLIPVQFWKEDSIRNIPGGLKFKSNTFTLQQSFPCGWHSSFLTKRKCRNSRIEQTPPEFPKSLSKDAAQALQASGNVASQLLLHSWCPYIGATES